MRKIRGDIQPSVKSIIRHFWLRDWLISPNRPASGLRSCRGCVFTTTLGYSIAALWLSTTCWTQTTVSWPKSWSKVRCWKSSQWLARRRTIPRGRRPLMWHAPAWSKLWILISSNPSPALLECWQQEKQQRRTFLFPLLNTDLKTDFFSKLFFHIQDLTNWIQNSKDNLATYKLVLFFFTEAVWG